MHVGRAPSKDWWLVVLRCHCSASTVQGPRSEVATHARRTHRLSLHAVPSAQGGPVALGQSGLGRDCRLGQGLG